jgi:hypothetical protein
MRGEGAFLGGQLHVVATVARGFEHGGKGGPRSKPRRGTLFRKGDTDAYKEDFNWDSEASEDQQKEMLKELVRQDAARRAAGSPMPQVTLQVAFENRGNQPIEIVPTDVNSDLGNFAVRPPKLTIAPGEKGVLDPMVSQLGVTNDEIPVTIAIKVGGKSETQVVLLKNLWLETHGKTAGAK